MRALCLSLCALGLSLLLAGCGGDSPKSITQEMVANMKEMASILDSIKDEDTAKAAVPKIGAVRAKMKDVGQRAKSVRVTASAEKEMNEMMMKELADVMVTLAPAQQKLMALMESNPKVKEIIEPALAGMENDL